MDIYERFDRYFQYSYFNKSNEKVGVFSKNITQDVLEQAEFIFDIIEYEK